MDTGYHFATWGMQPPQEQDAPTALDLYCSRLAKRGIVAGTRDYSLAMNAWQAALDAVELSGVEIPEGVQ